VERTYAGTLGLVAFLVALTRGWMLGGGTNAVLLSAWLSLLVFAPLGYFLGWLGGWIVDDAMKTRVAAELAARTTAPGKPGATPAKAGSNPGSTAKK
jgi:NhaP-type Na+/H+ or K+/H+ antiporter